MDSAGFLPQANERCEWMWKIYFKFAIAFLLSMVFSMICSILVSWLTKENLDATQFYRLVGIMYAIL